MILPPPIQAFFDADSSNGSAALATAFALDAVVKDEGRSHSGLDAIEAWSRAAKNKYQHVAEPLDWSVDDDGTHCVRARLTGHFPGSPATLHFAFRLRGDRIAHLEIGA